MEEDKIKDLKEFAFNSLVRSKDEVSQDKEIIEKLKDKVVIIKENNQIEITYRDDGPQLRIPLYLIGKFIGHKVLGMFDDSSASVEEISQRLNMPPQALSRPLGILLRDILEKTEKGYKVRAFKILDFLESLENKNTMVKTDSPKKTRKVSSVTAKVLKEGMSLNIKSDGIAPLADFLGILEEDVRKLFFFRENDLRIIDPKFINAVDTKERHLDYSLAYLVALKHSFDLDKCHSSFLRNKLQLSGVQSLTNLTTNLHKYPEYVIHDAGKKGSTDNYLLITTPGESRIKEKILQYITQVKGNNGQTEGSGKNAME